MPEGVEVSGTAVTGAEHVLSGDALAFVAGLVRQSGARRDELLTRRVEIIGPTERKMMINALDSGARVWLADLEHANTPHWHNVVGGQVNLRWSRNCAAALFLTLPAYELID